jgi:hypothetical protein
VVIVSTADIDRVDQVKIRLRVWLLRWFFCRSILIFGWDYCGVQSHCATRFVEILLLNIIYSICVIFFPVNSMTIIYDKFKLSIF